VLTPRQEPDGCTFDEVRMAADKLPPETPEELAIQKKEQEGLIA